MNIPDNIWKIARVTLIIFTVLLAVATLNSLSNMGNGGHRGDKVPNTITVSGTGEAVAIPDVATFSFSVTQKAKTVVEAQTGATKKINDALKAVRDAGVADKDIQTTSYNINPHYEYISGGVCSANYCPPGKSVMTGYDVSQSIQVKVRDLSKAGSIFASIGSLEVENVNGLNFSVDDPDMVKNEARDKAIANAKEKAKLLAKQLGVRLVRVNSFSENNDSYPRPMMYSFDSASVGKGGAVSPEIPAGESKFTNNVTIVYEIE